MELRARIASTRQVPKILVDAQFESHIVHLFCEPGNSMRETLWISNELPMAISSLGKPAVIDVYVFIAILLVPF